jgi:hypothetical protein
VDFLPAAAKLEAKDEEEEQEDHDLNTGGGRLSFVYARKQSNHVVPTGKVLRGEKLPVGGHLKSQVLSFKEATQKGHVEKETQS